MSDDRALRALTKFATDPTVEQLTSTPCCGASLRLSERAFAHVGRPTKRERTTMQFTTWTVICPTCDRWLHVSYEHKLRARYCVGSYSTYRRIVGTPIWRDAFTDDEFVR